MEVCYGNHEEIVFNGKSCPICWILNIKMPSLKKELGRLIVENGELKGQLDKLGYKLHD